MRKLKCCPFCGGEARIKKGSLWLRDYIVIECKNCRSKTRNVLIDSPAFDGTKLIESTRYTEEQATRLAIERWNRRCEN